MRPGKGRVRLSRGFATVVSRVTNLVVLFLVVAANALVWWLPNRPMEGVPALARVGGVTYSPYQPDQDALRNDSVDARDVHRDLALLRGLTDRIRTYSVLDGGAAVPQLARGQGLSVTLGAWLDTRLERNEEEIRKTVELANRFSSVERVTVGNETLLRGDLTIEQLIHYLRRVRAQVTAPVGTAETWDVWLEHPELGAEVDFIAIHVLPYWDKIPVERAVDYVLARYREVERAFPGKPVVLGEVGWPSEGRPRSGAVASSANQALFLREFASLADRLELDYYVIEGFDQPWKGELEGAVGAYWGIYDTERQPKFAFTGPIVPMEGWPGLAALASLASVLVTLWVFRRASDVRPGGRLLVAASLQVAASVLVWTGYMASGEYQTAVSATAWVTLITLLAALLAYGVLEAFDAAELLYRRRLERFFPAVVSSARRLAPKVSVHVPICNEPPQMVIQTLQALSQLDYPDYEVLVVDNNTADPALWEPVRAACKAFGRRFRFFHLDRCPGFKAGALNFALSRTHRAAKVIAVVDSDYVVEREWLRNLVPYFENRRVAIVQAPQDYRDWQGDPFKTACYWEYAGFFHLGMVQRNERNAIIQHGTMTLVRRRALDEAGRWGEWCICEDAELGLRILERGFESVYVRHSYGRGLTPDSFAAYKRQRFRWAYGAVQILRRHLRALLTGRGARLTAWQRHYFVAGWVPWLADGLNLAFAVLALGWTAGLLLLPGHFDFPHRLFLAAPVAVFAFKAVKTLWVYGRGVRCGTWLTFGAMLAAMSLSHTIGRAVIKGLFTSNQPFLRTPKCENQPLLVRGMMGAWEEWAMLLLLVAGAAAVASRYGGDDPAAPAWVALLCVNAVPYVAAAAMSLLNVVPSMLVQFRRRRALRPRRGWAAASGPVASAAEAVALARARSADGRGPAGRG